MRELGLAGVRRGKVKRTTVRDDAMRRPADLVNRDFHAQRPDQLWVCDLTYLRTWVGFAYLALVIDVFARRIVGWALAGHMRTELPLEALELAVWTRQQQRLTGWSITPTRAANIWLSATPTPCPKPVQSHPWEALVTRMTTHSPSPPSARSKPN
jgi:transposase InsO family protein